MIWKKSASHKSLCAISIGCSINRAMASVILDAFSSLKYLAKVSKKSARTHLGSNILIC